MLHRIVPLSLAAAALSACAATTSPVEVTRFHDPAALQQSQGETVFITNAAGETDSLELAPYKAAIAEELRRLGYFEGERGSARLIASVDVERYRLGAQGRRSPVSVGVGGSTGSYGSGIGLGLGINLGGGGGERVGTDMSVVLRDAATGNSVWEGRASVTMSPNADLAATRANAQAVAGALFREFPGNSGETVEVVID